MNEAAKIDILWAIVTGITGLLSEKYGFSTAELRESLQQTMMREAESPQLAGLYEELLNQFFDPLDPSAS